MFEQTFIEGRAKTSRGWPVVVSFSLQVCGIAVALAVPLLNPELLPRMAMTVYLAAPSPPPPPPPPPPAGSVVRAARTPQRVFDGARLLEPQRIPQQVAMIVEAPESTTPGVPGGIDSGVPGGSREGVPGGILDALPRPAPPPPPQPAVKEPPAPKPIPRLPIGGNVQQAKLSHYVEPVYPPLARNARIEGLVKFTAVISREGVIQQLQMIEGHPLLVQAAADAVRQWRYRPTLLNGDPAEVVTVIEVRFKLSR
jgi:protein TonB